MYKLSFFTLFVFVVINNGSVAKVLPDYIKPCPGLKSDCLKKTIQEVLPRFVKGEPSLGIESIDPLKSDLIFLNLPGGFKVELSDGVGTGYRKCIIDDAKYEDSVADLKFHCNITIKGKYKANGNLLIVAINGEGDAKIKLTNVIIRAKVYFHDVVRDGVVYHEIKKYDVNQRIDDKVTFDLTNLFKGNPQLSETVLLFLNENWKQLVDEFGQPIFDKMSELLFNIISKFFAAVPKNEIDI